MLSIAHENELLLADPLLRVPCQTDAALQVHGDVSGNRRDMSVLQRHHARRDDAPGVHVDDSDLSQVSTAEHSSADADADAHGLSPACELARAIVGRTVTRETVVVGCRLYQKLCITSKLRRPDGTIGAVGLNFDDPDFIEYLTCVSLAAKAHVCRGEDEYHVMRRVMLALCAMGATRERAVGVWARVVECEWDVLERLDWGIFDV
jgi:hypothetical protein